MIVVVRLSKNPHSLVRLQIVETHYDHKIHFGQIQKEEHFYCFLDDFGETNPHIIMRTILNFVKIFLISNNILQGLIEFYIILTELLKSLRYLCVIFNKF